MDLQPSSSINDTSIWFVEVELIHIVDDLYISRQNFPSVRCNLSLPSISNILLSITNRDVETAVVIGKCEFYSNCEIYFSDVNNIALDILQEEIHKKNPFQCRNKPSYLKHIKKKIRPHIAKVTDCMETEENKNDPSRVMESDDSTCSYL